MVDAPAGARSLAVRPLHTLVLLVVVALAGAALWLFELRGADERAEAEEAARRVFPDVEASEVTWIELRTPEGRSARLERSEEGGWRLVAPLAFPADDLTADGIASGATELVSERVFEEHEPLEAYGLDGDPVLRFGTDTRSFALRVGGKTPVGGNTYVAPEDGDPVYAVATWRTNALRKSLDDLRDASVLDFDRDAVSALEAAWPGGRVRLERPDGTWRLVEPVASEADAEAVPDAELGLADPAYQVELAREGEAAPVRLVVGSTSDGETRVVRGREGRLYRIAASRLGDFPQSVAAFRFKELARFDVPAARRLELVFHSAEGAEALRIEGTRGEAGWRTEPQPMAPGKAGALLTTLSGLDASGVAADAMGEDELAALGLAPPRARIRVLGEATQEDGEPPVLADVALGVARTDRGIAARRADREEVFWVDPQAAEHLPVSREAWANRFRANEAEAGAPEAAGTPEDAAATADDAAEGG